MGIQRFSYLQRNINMISEKITRKKWTTPAYRQCADPPFPEFQHISHSAHVVQAQILPCCTQQVEINAFRIQFPSVLKVSTHDPPKQAHATFFLFFPFLFISMLLSPFYHISSILCKKILRYFVPPKLPKCFCLVCKIMYLALNPVPRW